MESVRMDLKLRVGSFPRDSTDNRLNIVQGLAAGACDIGEEASPAAAGQQSSKLRDAPKDIWADRHSASYRATLLVGAAVPFMIEERGSQPLKSFAR